MSRFEINSHAHIFNFSSVFTKNSLEILLRRLKAEKLPGLDGKAKELLIDKIADLLKPLVEEAGQKIDPRVHLKNWLSDLSKDIEFDELMKADWSAGSVELQLINENDLVDLGVNVLAEILGKIWKEISTANDVRKVSLSDIVAFLYIGLQPNIEEVTALLMEQIPDNGGVVALSMDVGGESEEDRAVIAKQHRDVSEQVLYYPGRLLPFVAINPSVAGFETIMETALEKQGFVGVKLYPSLGFQISDGEQPTEQMNTICRYCQKNQVPILCHCSRDGFYSKEEYRDWSDPALWEPCLKKYKGLKVCFAHFGGDKNFFIYPIQDDTWTKTILNMMEAHPGVYADVAHHNSPMLSDKPVEEENYFANLRDILGKSRFKERILYGTDFFMVRRIARDDSFRSYFLENLNKDQENLEQVLFDQMAVINPVRYLGLPDEQGNVGNNIAWYRDFIVSRHQDCRSEPAPWLINVIANSGTPLPKFNYTQFGCRWTMNNQAHYWLYNHLCNVGAIPDREDYTSFSKDGGMLLSNIIPELRGHVPDRTKNEAIGDFAKAIAIVFYKDGVDGKTASFSGDYEITSAIEAIVKLINKNSMRLVDLAELVDEIFICPEEMGQ